jgi:hypothetical protein
VNRKNDTQSGEMTTPDGANHKRIITWSLLAGLTPLIPVPFVDDIAKTYFKRRMTRELAAIRNQALSATDVKTLADDADTGCLRGCAITVLVYPLKWIFRKVFIFLEWKRAIDIVTHTYYQGYLIDYALSQGWTSGSLRARAAIDRVLTEVNPSIIERAVKETFLQSKNILKSAARLLQSSLQRITRRASQEQIEETLQSIEPQEEREIESVVARLQRSIERIPSDHFDRLRAMLADEIQKTQ